MSHWHSLLQIALYHSPQSTVLHGTGRTQMLPLHCCVFAQSEAFTSGVVKGTWGHGVKMEMWLIKLWEVRQFFLIIHVLLCTRVMCCLKPGSDVQRLDTAARWDCGNVQFAFSQDFRMALTCQKEPKLMARHCLNPPLADTCNFINHFPPAVNTIIVRTAGSVKSSRENILSSGVWTEKLLLWNSGEYRLVLYNRITLH